MVTASLVDVSIIAQLLVDVSIIAQLSTDRVNSKKPLVTKVDTSKDRCCCQLIP